MISCSQFEHTNYEHETFRHSLVKSNDYKVFLGGEEIPVYTCRISAYPFNCVWKGHQRNIDQTEEVSFVNLVGNESAQIEVQTSLPKGKIMIKPYSKGVSFVQNEDKICFTLNENGAYVLEIGSYHQLLYIFYHKPIETPRKEDVTYFFDKGIHFAGKIDLKDDESIYVDKDAYVYGTIGAKNAKNIRVFGNGVMDGGTEERVGLHCYEPYINGNARFYNCQNVAISGVGFTNSALWCVSFFACRDIAIEDICVFGQWRYNTDGIDLCNCQNALIKNSFIHSFDDTIAIKGIERYREISCKNITVQGCVLWCDWGKTMEIGLETRCKEYDDILFTDCDVLRGGNTVCDIQCGDYGEIHHITFENIRVEVEKFYTPEVYQASDSERYQEQDKTMRTFLLKADNRQFDSPEWEIFTDKSLYDERSATVHDVTCKNITVYMDEKIEKLSGKYDIPIGVHYCLPNKKFYRIQVENVVVNGKKLTKEDCILYLDDEESFMFME